ncbi:MAG: hypothetical protein JSW68_13435, partial [Burkholderiales bacterium]
MKATAAGAQATAARAQATAARAQAADLAEDSIRRRYREPVAPIGLLGDRWNETLSTLLEHRSVRAFRTDPLPAGTLETL